MIDSADGAEARLVCVARGCLTPSADTFRRALHTYVNEGFDEAAQVGYPNMKVFKSNDKAHGRTEARIVRAMPLRLAGGFPQL